MTDHFTINHNNCQTPFYPQDSGTPFEIIQSNSTHYNPGIKTIYKTPKRSFLCICFSLGVFIMITFYGFFTFIYINQRKKDIIYAFVFITIWCIAFMSIFGCRVLYSSITIDPISGTFLINNKKLCCCFSKTKEFKIDELKKVKIQKDYRYYSKSNNMYRVFKVQILLQNNLIINGFSEVLDKNNESQKAYNILRNSLPNNIDIEYI